MRIALRGGMFMFIKNWKKEIISIPNLLSLFRLALIPVYIVIYFNATEAYDYYLSAGILAVSCLTDLIDGKIARRFNMVTTLGILLDPVADKATQFTLVLCLALRYPVLWYLVGLFVIKEGFQLIAGSLILRKGKILDGALITGKICTTVLFVSLIGMVMFPNLTQEQVTIITLVDAGFMIVSFIGYILIYCGKIKRIQDLPDAN